MSDCSGADVGIMALKALGFVVNHVSSCDNASGPMKWVLRNFKPAIVMHDLFCRDLSAHGAVMQDIPVYIAGFPCTPFSTLHNQTTLMRDPNARQFLAVARTIKQVQSKIIVLENVRGILRCWRRVEQHLAACGSYHLHKVSIDPACLGCDVTRARIYIVMVHKSVFKDGLNDGDFKQLIDRKVDNVKAAFTAKAPVIPWSQMMFDNTQEVAQKMRKPAVGPLLCRCSKCKGRGGASADLAAPPGKAHCKWRVRHWEFMRENNLDPKNVVGAFKASFPGASLPSLWQTHMSDIIIAQHKAQGMPSPLVWDISQSIGRTSAKGDGQPLGCIT